MTAQKKMFQKKELLITVDRNLTIIIIILEAENHPLTLEFKSIPGNSSNLRELEHFKYLNVFVNILRSPGISTITSRFTHTSHNDFLLFTSVFTFPQYKFSPNQTQTLGDLGI